MVLLFLNKPTLMSDFNNIIRIAEALLNEGVDFIIVGGIAVILYGMPRVSESLDILIKLNQDNIEKIKNSLLKIFNDEDIKEISLDEIENYSVIRYISQNNEILDIIGNLGEMFNFDTVEFNYIEFDGNKFKVATPSSLINMKSNTYREKDSLDLLFLKELIKNKNAN